MIKRINDNYYKVYCPICDYWFDGSEYLMTIFENNDYYVKPVIEPCYYRNDANLVGALYQFLNQK